MIDIRPANEGDFEAYYNIKCTKSDVTWTGPYSAPPQEDTLYAAFIGRIGTQFVSGSKCLYMIVEDEIVKGYVMFTINEADIELGYSIYEPYQKQGVGKKAMRLAVKEALKHKPLVFVQIRDDNFPSQKCCMAVGFQRTEECYDIEYPTVGKSKMRKYIIAADRYTGDGSFVPLFR